MRAFEPTERSLMIGRRLRTLRTAARKSMREVIEESGLDMSDTTLSRLERGERAPIDGELYSLAKVYGVTLQHITRKESPVDGNGFKFPIHEEAKPASQIIDRPAVPKPGPHLVKAPATVTMPPTVPLPVRTPIPANLPPQPSSALLTPGEYLERVYVPGLERRIAELTAANISLINKLAEANRLLQANGHQAVSA